MSVDGLLPVERRWLAEDPSDPRANCPNREQHAVRLYGDRWAEGFLNPPRLDGKSVARTHTQISCEGCDRYMIWLPKSPARTGGSTPESIKPGDGNDQSQAGDVS